MGRSLDTHIVLAIAVNSLTILTTIHAQDFQDEFGDRLQGRQTLPIAWLEGSRTLMLIMTLVWFFVLISISPVKDFYAAAFAGIGAIVSMRLYFQRSAGSDELSYLLL